MAAYTVEGVTAMSALSVAGVFLFPRSVEQPSVAVLRDTVNGARPWRAATSEFSYCQVDAGGVPAEWVESTVASERQPTIVFFLISGHGADALEQSRPTAGDLAAATGARVLTVACSANRTSPHAAAVENGMAAYAWLLGEGCDLGLAAFTHDATDASLVDAILVAAGNRGLPVPASLIWPGSSGRVPPGVAG